MVPICFYVSVCLMHAENQMVEKYNNSNYSSTIDECRRQDEAVRFIDTILLEEVIMVNPTSLTITHAEIEDTKVAESTVTDQTFAKNDTDGDLSSSRMFPSVPFDSESSKENPIKTSVAKETNTSYNKEKDIHATKVNPEVAFDSESNKDEGEIDRVADIIII